MGGEDGEREEDPGGGGGGEGQGQDEKQGREVEKHGGKESGGLSTGRVHLKGALLQTYVLSILIRSIMEVHDTITLSLLRDLNYFFKPLLTNCFWLHSTFTLWYSLSSKSWQDLVHDFSKSALTNLTNG